MRNKKFTAVYLAASGAFLLWANACLADVSLLDASPVGDVTIPELIGYIIKAILGITGAVALFMFVYGGVMMIISGGKTDKIQKAKDVLTWAIIGLVVIFSSYLLVAFVISGITSGSPGLGGGGKGGDGGTCALNSGSCVNVSNSTDNACKVSKILQGDLCYCASKWVERTRPAAIDTHDCKTFLCPGNNTVCVIFK